MSGFRGDLISEIEFAKKHFDFTEITIQPELLEKIEDILPGLKKAVGSFAVLGHVHWEIVELDAIKKNIEVLKVLGAQKITMHPFNNLSIEENVAIFKGLDIFLQKNCLQLLIENVSSAPFNFARELSQLLEKIPNAKITLDIGHANRNKELDKFLEIFKNRIGHIHLHHNVGNSDHLFYTDKGKIDAILARIKSFDYDDTILLETFSIVQDGKNVSQEFPEIKKLHIGQLEYVQ